VEVRKWPALRHYDLVDQNDWVTLLTADRFVSANLSAEFGGGLRWWDW
jgi:hypothetical protein